MKIAIISKNYHPPWNEGVKNITREIVEYLRSKMDIVEVITNRKSGSNIFTFLNFCIKRIKKLNPDVIFYISSVSPILGLKTFFLKKMTHTPFVLYVTGNRKFISGYNILLRADKVLVNCNYLKRFFRSSSIIYPIARSIPRKQMSLNRENNVLFLGAFEKSRGVDYLIKAISRIKNIPGLKLIIAWNQHGSDYNKIKKLIKKNRISHITEVKGNIDINKFYSIAKVIVIPRTSKERMSFPLRVIESFSYNTPVIASNIVGLPEAVGKAGILVRPKDEKALSGAIKAVLTNDKIYNKLLINCKVQLNKFDKTRNLEKLYKVLENVSKKVL